MFGVLLFEFLVKIKIISITNEVGYPIVKFPKKKKGGGYFISRGLYAICTFDLSLLPVKLNLPMVCEPLPWKATTDNPKSLSDIRGGDLDMPTGDFYSNYRYKLLTSRNLLHFNIRLEREYDKMCDVMNKLQSQPFSCTLLRIIAKNWSNLVY